MTHETNTKIDGETLTLETAGKRSGRLNIIPDWWLEQELLTRGLADTPESQEILRKEFQARNGIVHINLQANEMWIEFDEVTT